MLRVPEHYTHFGARRFGHASPATDPSGATPGAVVSAPFQTVLRKARTVVLWGVFGVPALLVMAVWQFVDRVDPRYGQEHAID